MAHAGGRPTKYEPGWIEIARLYIDSCNREATELPTIEGLALRIGVDDDQLNEWGKIYPEFHAAIKDLKLKQKNQLINDGLYGGKEVNQAMAIFLLKANHDMIETERKMLVGKDGESLPVPILNVLTDDRDKETPETVQED
jgi:hypothetical protein